LGDEDHNSGVMLVHRILVDAETQMDGDSDALQPLLPAPSVNKETLTENDKDSCLIITNTGSMERMTDTRSGRFRPHMMSALWCSILLAIVMLAIAISYWGLTFGFISTPGGPSYYDCAAWAAYNSIQPGGEGFAPYGGDGFASYLSYYDYRVALAGVDGGVDIGRIVPT
jgi:hypothetical protein